MEAIHASWSSIVRDDQAQLAPTYATSCPLEQYAVYARVQRRTSYGTSYLETTFQSTYSDVVHSEVFPTIPNRLLSARAGLNTSPADLLDQANAYDQPFSDNAQEVYSQQGWQMPNHDTGAIAQERGVGLGHSGADLYVQDTQIPPLGDVSYSRAYAPRFTGNPASHQVSSGSAGHQCENLFTVEGLSHRDHQVAYRQLYHNAAIPVQKPTQAREPPLRDVQVSYLPLAPTPHSAQATRYWQAGGEIIHNRSAMTCSASHAPAASPLNEQGYSTEGAPGYCFPDRGTGLSVDGLSSDAFVQGTFNQRANVPHLGRSSSAQISGRSAPHIHSLSTHIVFSTMPS
ncbi:hypothetical protein TRAPUB_13761 [Trametes pubescens]|uniref:Uncharacterized protein n=1 Tax=Trametes pubescens TaxID=154538 RepID=A0A1M2VQN5_TRAPU|nr:hypothetical protein TRAPUB_13761 [Trametes pubescens]